MPKRLTIGDIDRICERRGGVCHDKIYVNTKTRMRIGCGGGHLWFPTAAQLRAGQWCPICKSSDKEHLCRTIFELLFNTDYQKCRPGFLKNPETGYKLELDGYCYQLNLAFEYQGKQHYKKTNWCQNRLDEITKRDAIKADLCKENNVILIIIPYWIRPNQLLEYIIRECRKNAFLTSENINYSVDDIMDIAYAPLPLIIRPIDRRPIKDIIREAFLKLELANTLNKKRENKTTNNEEYDHLRGVLKGTIIPEKKWYNQDLF